MHRPGCDPDNMVGKDFLCDFCLRCWREDLSMVEGHRGSLICIECLTKACRAVLLDGAGIAVPPYASCALCLRHISAPHWQSHGAEGNPIVCQECIERSAGMLERDPSAKWSRPKHMPGHVPGEVQDPVADDSPQQESGA